MLREEMSVHCFSHQAMGTMFEAMIAGCEASYARGAAQAAFAEVDRLERLFSRFDATSEVSQINRLQLGESRRVGVETYECLTIAEKIRIETGGAFDVNFRSGQKFATEKKRGKAVCLVLSSSQGFSVAVGEDGPGLVAPATKLDLDLGGIGKGFALDKAAEVFAAWEVDRFLVHAGTSTALACGDAPGLSSLERGWPVGAGAGYLPDKSASRLLLLNRALSGSGSEVKGCHIIDPRRGEPASQFLAVWVSHPRAAEADALSTAFMAMTLEEIERYCRVNPRVWASVVTPDEHRHFFNQEILV